MKEQKNIKPVIAQQISTYDFFLSKYSPKLRNVLEAAFSTNFKGSLKNLIPDTGNAVILSPDTAQDIVYFVDSFGKFILQKYHTIYTENLQTGMNLVGGSAPGMVFKGASGSCGDTTETFLMPRENAPLTPNIANAFMEQCWRDFPNSELYFMTASDLRDNADFKLYFQTLIADVIYKDMLRLFWWGNYVPASFASPTPDLVGTVASYFTVGTGLWKRIEADTSIPYVPNAYNTAASYALQEMSGDDAYALISDCVRKISTRSGMPEIHVTPYIYKSLLDKFAQTTDFNRGALNGKFDDTNQVVGLFWGTYPIINRLDWGDVTENYFNDGTKYDKPNRVFIYDKRYIAVAYNKELLLKSAFGDLSYDERTETVFKRFSFVFDANYLASSGKLFVKSY